MAADGTAKEDAGFASETPAPPPDIKCDEIVAKLQTVIEGEPLLLPDLLRLVGQYAEHRHRHFYRLVCWDGSRLSDPANYLLYRRLSVPANYLLYRLFVQSGAHREWHVEECLVAMSQPCLELQLNQTDIRAYKRMGGGCEERGRVLFARHFYDILKRAIQSRWVEEYVVKEERAPLYLPV